MVEPVLGIAPGVVRVTENTTLGLDKLTLTDTGATTVVEVQLNLPGRDDSGQRQQTFSASTIRKSSPQWGGRYRANRASGSARPVISCSSTATMVFVYVRRHGAPTPYTLVGPPAVYFSPVDGVKPAPEDLVAK